MASVFRSADQGNDHLYPVRFGGPSEPEQVRGILSACHVEDAQLKESLFIINKMSPFATEVVEQSQSHRGGTPGAPTYFILFCSCGTEQFKETDKMIMPELIPRSGSGKCETSESESIVAVEIKQR